MRLTYTTALKLFVPAPGGDVDLTKSDDEKEDEASKLRRKLGFPEMDPDALPSTNVTKYVKLIST